MQILITKLELYFLKRAISGNKTLILFLFFIPFLVFSGIFIGTLALTLNFIVFNAVLKSRDSLYAFIIFFILLPPLIFLLASRLYREKRLIPRGEINLISDSYFIKVGSLNLPISRVVIEIIEKPFLMPENIHIVKLVFPFEPYLYKEGELNFSYFYEYTLRGYKEVKNIRTGSTIAIYLPMKKEKLGKFISSLKEYPNIGVKLSKKSKMKEMFKDFEEKRTAKIIVKEFSMIGF